jgi:uncharacterized protein YggE
MEVDMLKRLAGITLTLGLMIAVGLAGVWLWGQLADPVAAQTEGAGYQATHAITVLGQGSVRIEPDIAQVSIGVETSAGSVAQATEENATQMEAILSALTAAGIPDKDIQTTNFSIHIDRNPEPRPVTTEPVLEDQQFQYVVSNMVSVTIRDLDAVSDVLDAVIAAGANNIWGVSFSVEDQEAAIADARAKAIADAKARAEALAELGEVELGPVMAISEVVGGGAVPMPMMLESAAKGGGPISPGELEVGYQVQVSYYIEP